MRRIFAIHGPALAAAAALALSGCSALTRDTLVNEAGRPHSAATVSHCSGSEWTDNSMIAVFPLPILSFASPTQEINRIEPDEVLARCGPANRLVDRRVEVDRTWCIPTAITRLLTLGIWHWCPAEVSWDADVAAPTTAAAPRVAPPEPTSSYAPGSGS